MLNILTGGFLKGYRSYILGAALALQAVASFVVGDLGLNEFLAQLPEIIAGMGFMSVRAAIPK